MIKPNELRMGNTLLHKDKFVIVDGIDNATEEYHGCWLVWLKGEGMSYNIAEFVPIPLTPQWLERMGFVLWADGWYKKKLLGGVRHICCSLKTYVYGISDEHHHNQVVFGNILHVHQLQNLYFALTGEELSIKMPTELK